MAKITVNINGIQEKIREYDNLSKEISTKIDALIQDAADKWVNGAKRDAPVNLGRLRNAISYRKDKNNIYEIVAQAYYAPFIEFGTKGKYKPIPGTEEIAAQYKGLKGQGGIDAFFESILEWVRKKGFNGRYSVKTRKRLGSVNQQRFEDFDIAFSIMMSILKKGINPHPFFFKQMETVWPNLISDIEALLKPKVSVIRAGDIKRPRIVTI